MASKDVKGETPQTLNYKTWFLRVSVHCEGCKKKVKKILFKVPGVHSVDIDIRQQKAIVIGNVEADALIGKLTKSRKRAELWPEQPMQKEKKPQEKSKNREKQPNQHLHQESPNNQENVKVKIQKPSGQKRETKLPAVKIEALKKTPTKKSKEKVDDLDVNVKKKSKDNDEDTKSFVIQSKDSGRDHHKKKPKSKGQKVKDGVATPQPPPEAKKHGSEGGKNVKKKTCKGKNGDKVANIESGNHHNGATSITPHQYGYHDDHPPYGSHHFGHGPLTSYSYSVSYNTVYPIDNHTTSYYAPSTQQNAYAYMYQGAEVHSLPPSLDSFEMFSDENPNGCLVM